MLAETIRAENPSVSHECAQRMSVDTCICLNGPHVQHAKNPPAEFSPAACMLVGTIVVRQARPDRSLGSQLKLAAQHHARMWGLSHKHQGHKMHVIAFVW